MDAETESLKRNDSDKKQEKLQCGLCGFTFTRGESTKACKACSSFMKCNLLKCPNCGYEFPNPETATGRLIKSIARKIKRKSERN
ncbi:MAG: hypothetical protein ACXADA_19665 [Candidatus Hodarchaeales archaeon]